MSKAKRFCIWKPSPLYRAGVWACRADVGKSMTLAWRQESQRHYFTVGDVDDERFATGIEILYPHAIRMSDTEARKFDGKAEAKRLRDARSQVRNAGRPMNPQSKLLPVYGEDVMLIPRGAFSRRD